MSSEKARIALAEAMGWKYVLPEGAALCHWEYGSGTDKKIKLWTAELPDPLTNANHDHDVLEWAKSQWKVIETPHHPTRPYSDKWYRFVGSLPHSCDYKKGDFFRAACYVLRIRDEL